MRLPSCSNVLQVLLATLVTACTRPNPAFHHLGVSDAGDTTLMGGGGGGGGGVFGGSGGGGGTGPGDTGLVPSDGPSTGDASPPPQDETGGGGVPGGDAAPLTADAAPDVPADVAPASPVPAPVAHWTLDSTVVNQRNGAAGGLSGTAGWSGMFSPGNRPSNAGSLRLNGGIGHARLGVGGLPRYESAKTVSLWYWTNTALSPTSGRKYLLVMTSNSAGAALELLVINGYPTAFIGGTEPGGTDVISSVPARAGWNHLVYTFNPTDPLGANMNTVYVDTMVGRTRGMALRPGAVSQALLGTVEPGQVDSKNFDGLIDDVRIYDRALSRAEIQALFNGAP